MVAGLYMIYHTNQGEDATRNMQNQGQWSDKGLPTIL